jgi:H+/Cl- antiporter ClcA
MVACGRVILSFGCVAIARGFQLSRQDRTQPRPALVHTKCVRQARVFAALRDEDEARVNLLVRTAEDVEETVLAVDESNGTSPPASTSLLLPTLHERSTTPGGDDLLFRTTSFDLLQAGIIGSLTGFSVAIFKLSIEQVRMLFYSQPFLAQAPWLMALIPALGGAATGALMLLGAFPPGLRGAVKEVDDEAKSPTRSMSTLIAKQLQFFRKSTASVFTLGTGNSLGPEGPSVEIGLSCARACLDYKPKRISQRKSWNRLLLSCGAAAGVAAGFNAPIAGVFFALEIMQNTFASIREETGDNSVGENLLATTTTITPILLASVLSALIANTLLGSHLVLALSPYSLKTPLVELPLYLLLGVVSGGVAWTFGYLANKSRDFFAGELGTSWIRGLMQSTPASVKPIIAGLLCGVVAQFYPQIMFFGYETLNSLLSNNSLPTTLALSLLAVKICITAISAGSGLIGGTFAPSLFLGAMTGATFHNIMTVLFQKATSLASPGWLVSAGIALELADIPAYAMVGAASVLAALFRAPLTASLLLFELTRDYEVIIPLMASAGVASVVGDLLEEKFKRLGSRANEANQQDVRSDCGNAWGDLGSEACDLEGSDY